MRANELSDYRVMLRQYAADPDALAASATGEFAAWLEHERKHGGPTLSRAMCEIAAVRDRHVPLDAHQLLELGMQLPAVFQLSFEQETIVEKELTSAYDFLAHAIEVWLVGQLFELIDEDEVDDQLRSHPSWN